jgi:hypothetical protein
MTDRMKTICIQIFDLEGRKTYIKVANKGLFPGVRSHMLLEATRCGVHLGTALIIAPEVPILLVGAWVGAHTVGGKEGLVTAIYRAPVHKKTSNHRGQ